MCGVPEPELSSAADFRRYFGVLRKRKLVVLLALVVVAGVAFAVGSFQAPTYQAAALLLIQEPATSASGSVFGQNSQAQTNASVLVGTQIEIVTSRPVRDAVVKQLGASPSVAVSEVGQTQVIKVRASSASPERAAKVANAWANAYIDFTRTQDINSDLAATTQIQSKVDDLQKQIDALDGEVANASPADRATIVANVGAQRNSLVTQQGLFRQRLDQIQVDSSLRTGAAQLVTPASVPTSPFSPKPVRDAILGLAVGLILGVGLAFLLDYLDDSVSSVDDLERATSGLANLALIPQVTGWKAQDEPCLISVEEPTSAAAEAYRSLRTAIQFIGLDHAARIIQITSPNAEEGKTTTLSNLGVALANAGQRVCLCCCDLRRPRIHQFFGLDNASGLTSVILGHDSLSAAVQPVPNVDGLFLLASGPKPPNPSELLASPRAAEVIRALSTIYDVVLIDCPPVLPVTDAAVIAGIVDATLLAVAAGLSARREVTRAVQVLQQVHAPLIGTVLNGVTAETGGGYYRQSHYHRYEEFDDYTSRAAPASAEPKHIPSSGQDGEPAGPVEAVPAKN